MQRDEILDRGRQALAKRSDAALGWLGYDFERKSRAPAPATPGNFFFASESVESIMELIRRRLPGRAERIIQEAGQICQHRFDFLGYVALDYRSSQDANIDWHWDPVHGKRAPKRAFYRVHYLDFAECGDSKVIWELNRHQHFVTLAKAYRLTSDRRYLEEILRQKRHWEAENPYPVGINWASSLEVAIRSLSWLWTYYLLAGSHGVPEFEQEWLPGLTLHGRHIERYLSTYFSPNTHLLGEAVALFFLGVLCPQLAAAQRWRSRGWEMIQEELQRQVLADGFHFERSTYYHVYAVDFFLHAAILAGRNGIPVPTNFADALERMLTALRLFGRDGSPQRFGDDDGGRVFDARRNREEHLLDPLATGAIWFHCGDYKASIGGLREETLWLLGDEGARQWDVLPETAVSKESATLPDAGYYLLAAEKTQLIVNVGPTGTLIAGHAHADALSITLQGDGHALLIDPGTCQYVPSGDRDLFRATAMHNTLTVDGTSQAETAGPFSWEQVVQSRVEKWTQGRSFDLLVASHNGYERLKSPVRHRRFVVSLKNGVFLVRDVVEGAGTHRVEIAWHLAPNLRKIGEGVFQVQGGDSGLVLLPAQGNDWAMKVQQESWSPVYGQKLPATALKFSADVELPAEFATLLIGSENARHSVASFRRIECSPDGNVSSYEYAAGGTEYTFFFSDRGGTWRSDWLVSDATYVCYRRQRSPFEEGLVFCDGSHARVGGGAELRCSRQVVWAESARHGNSCRVFSADPSAVLDHAPSEPATDPASAISGEA